MSSPGLRFLAVAVATLLVCDAAAAYQVGIRAQRPPSFRRGGRFLQAAGDEATAQASPADVTTTTSVLAAAPAPEDPCECPMTPIFDRSRCP